MYYPLTATPFHTDTAFRELTPHPALRGMLRCFWGGDSSLSREHQVTIIPDTCCDLIYRVNETTGTISGHYCGISSEPFLSHPDPSLTDSISIFAIRFFAWQAYRFSDNPLRGTLNAYTPAEMYFAWLDRALRPGLIQYHTLEERARYAEHLLFSITPRTICLPVQEAVGIMLESGRIGDISKLARSVFVSTRQLERLFAEHTGLSPKKLGNMIRYQMVWRDALLDPCFTTGNAVEKYGYFDEAHLHHEFVRYHGVNLKTACHNAQKDVAFLQDSGHTNEVSCP